ncbi:putative methyltransferase-domain-containing protein [Xylariaceae sp. FL1272]|nr:putative methyltransferase-domain-containing protein [Xylariaceae sp. FL1272]
MAVKKKKPSPKALSQGRPPTSRKPKSISRKATRALINTIHQLEKKKSQAVARGDKAAETTLDAEIIALGGIEKYQQASLQGQRGDRGGDSSRILLDWLKLQPDFSAPNVKPNGPLQMLEVGALSTNNLCSRCGFFNVQRIDLNSQSEGILQQDFMQRPLPTNATELFDIISLSLVLNFVPDARTRGDMLLRTLDFLKKPDAAKQSKSFPSLFLVLPAPCVTNSRYMDESLLDRIMTSIGYTKAQFKVTQKLVYYLWVRTSGTLSRIPCFTKTEIRTGSTRNNFSIIVRG